MPEYLDFMGNAEQSVAFFEKLRATVSNRRCRELVVDQRELKEISPAAALVFIAEMYRCNRLYPRVILNCRMPRADEPRELLGHAGFYDYAEEKSWQRKQFLHGRSYWKHRRGEGVRQSEAKALIDYLPTLGKVRTQLLYEALVEGMQNTSEHAYGKSAMRYRSWWLLGYWDSEQREVAFCFYDQGAGIPETIRTRLKDMLPFFRPPGSELICKAVVEGRYSRTKRKQRGRGLPTLKLFIDESRGELVIFSNESRCVFETGRAPLKSEFPCRLHGTLISWKLRPNET